MKQDFQESHMKAISRYFILSFCVHTCTLETLACDCVSAFFFFSAFQRYQDRIKEGGWKQELFVSNYRIAEANEKLIKGDDTVQEAFMRAHLTIPTRSEAVYVSISLRKQQIKQKNDCFLF